MKKCIYIGMALLVCLCLVGCGEEHPARTIAVETSTAVATALFAETTATAAETIAATTASETISSTTVASTALVTETLPVTTSAMVAETSIPAAETADPSDNRFLPSVLDGEYTYGDGGEPVIEVIEGVTYVNGILIANKTYSLPEDFVPGGLHPDAQAAFEKMQAAAAAEGLTLKIISGYRSYAQQVKTYATYSGRDGKEMADRYSARAGHSEHQTGLAMDINSLQQSFADTAEGKWLAEHCAEYGFIIRYGAGKEAQTGFMYEPWHIRYLGEETARAVTDSGLCLEEYLGITSVYAE